MTQKILNFRVNWGCNGFKFSVQNRGSEKNIVETLICCIHDTKLQDHATT